MKTKRHVLFITLTTLILLFCSLAEAKPERIKGQEGDSCNKDTFIDSCDGSKLLRCENNTVKAIDCSELTMSGLARICVEFENGPANSFFKALCMKEEDRCYKENETIVREEMINSRKTIKTTYRCEKTTNGDFFYRSTTADERYEKFHNRPEPKPAASKSSENELGIHGGESCDKENMLFEFCEMNSFGQALEVIYRCERSKNGDVLHLRRHSQAPCNNGSGTCSADGKCVPGERCDPNSYVAHCDGNETFNCNNLIITHRKCPGKTSCIVIDHKAECILAEKKSCQKEGEIVPTRCRNNREFYNECKKADDGKLYYLPAGNKKCSNGCDDNQVACKP